MRSTFKVIYDYILIKGIAASIDLEEAFILPFSKNVGGNFYGE